MAVEMVLRTLLIQPLFFQAEQAEGRFERMEANARVTLLGSQEGFYSRRIGGTEGGRSRRRTSIRNNPVKAATVCHQLRTAFARGLRDDASEGDPMEQSAVRTLRTR